MVIECETTAQCATAAQYQAEVVSLLVLATLFVLVLALAAWRLWRRQSALE